MERDDNQFELIDLVNIVRKRKWLIIIPTFICMVAAATLSYLLTPIWEVDAVMLPSKFFVQTTQGAFEEFLVADPTQIVGAINQESYNGSIASELNLDLKKFPKPKAEALRDTKLIRIAVRDKDIAVAKSVLQALFVRLKEELDKKIDVQMKAIDAEITYRENSIKANEIGIKDLDNQIATKRLQINDKENEIKTKENEIKKRNNDIRLKELEVKSREIEKERVRKEIEVDQNKLKISEERAVSILEEMKSVKGRIDAIDEQLKKALAERKQGGDAVGLLLYSNEIQQNLRYYNTLDEKQSTERITQENLRLAIRDKQQQLLQLDNQISQINTMVDSINAEIDNVKTEIAVIKTEIQKIGNEITAVKNEIEKIKNANDRLRSEITLYGDTKARIDYAQLVKKPTSSLYPVSPNKILNSLIAGVLALAIFTIFAFFREYLKKQKEERAESPGAL